MYSPARFAVVDDNPIHLQAVKDTLEALGTTCFPLLYDSSRDADPLGFRGVRVLFMDFHLSGPAIGTDSKTHSSAIASLLLDIMRPHPHPYVVVLWTAFPDQATELHEFLRERLKSQPRIIPMAVLCIDKNSFLDLSTGEVIAPHALKEEFDRQLAVLASSASVFDWEFSVLEAAASIVDQLGALVPDKAFLEGQTDAALDVILSRFAYTAGGQKGLTQPRNSVSYALGPLLADEILNRTPAASTSAIWKRGVTVGAGKLPRADLEQKGRLNGMAHLAAASSESTEPSDWGAVIVPEENEAWFGRFLSEPFEEFLKLNLKLSATESVGSKFALIRAGAECDFAQQKAGPVPYIPGALVLAKGSKWTGNPSQSVKRSVDFVHPDVLEGRPFQIHLDLRMMFTVPETYPKRWKALLRVREPLMNQIVSQQSAYSSRPGILEFS